VGGRVRGAVGRHGGRSGKRLTPLAKGASPSPDQPLEGDEARERLDEEQRGSTPRRQLENAPHFDDVSPAVGVLDEDAFDSALADDADGALELLGALVGATDRRLAEAARRLAARVVLDLTRSGAPRASGVGRMELRPADRADGDLDLDASLEPLQLARAGGTIAPLEDLRVSAWGKPSTAICLVIDRSGSMNGSRLATAALATAACAWRAGADHSVVAFSDDVVVVKSQDVARRPEAVADDVLRLRGMGPTDLAFALRVARDQLARSSAQRRVTILLSDCRPTTGSDPAAAAVLLDELVVVAPADDAGDAAAFARSVGARWTGLEGPSDIPAAFARLLD
jgi:Mg-chelatase subunit ChlD